GRVSRNSEKPPEKRPRLNVEGADRAPCPAFGTGEPDNHLSVENPGSSGDRYLAMSIYLFVQRLGRPEQLTSPAIKRDQASVLDAHDYLVLPDRQAANAPGWQKFFRLCRL